MTRRHGVRWALVADAVAVWAVWAMVAAVAIAHGGC